jgi:hypothetical protein
VKMKIEKLSAERARQLILELLSDNQKK